MRLEETVWKMFVVLSGRGGVGKSLLTMFLAVALLLRRRTPLLVEADLQKRLHHLFPGLVKTIDIDRLGELAEDPLALAKAFSAIPAAARNAAPSANTDVVVDTAATWHAPIISYAAEIALAKTVGDLGGQLVFVVPFTADADAVLLSIDTAQKIEQLLPDATLVFVSNEYPRPARFDLPALKALQPEIKRLFGKYPKVRLPAINERFWGPFERAGMSVMDVSSGNPPDLMGIAEADIDAVVVMQGRVEAWTNAVMAELEPLLQFRGAAGQNPADA